MIIMVEENKPNDIKKEETVTISKQQFDDMQKIILDLQAKLQQPIIQPATQQPTNKLNELMQNPMALQMLTQLMGNQTQENSLESFFKQLGERTFYKLVDKMLPSHKELKTD